MEKLDDMPAWQNGATVCSCCGSRYNDATVEGLTTGNPGIRIVRHPKKTMRPKIKINTRNGVLGLYLKTWEK